METSSPNANGATNVLLTSKLVICLYMYSLDHDKVSDMLDYILTMPPAEADHQRGHKYAYYFLIQISDCRS